MGDGPEKGKLKSLVSELKLDKNVDFSGFLEDYNEAISSHEILLHICSALQQRGLWYGGAGGECLRASCGHHRAQNECCDGFGHEGDRCGLPANKEGFGRGNLRMLPKKEKMRGRCIEEAKKYDWERACDRAEKVL